MSYTQQDLARDLEEDFRRARNNVTQKQKLNELMDKYGETREEIESKSTMEDWMRFKMANGDELLDTVRTERAAERLRRREAATAMYNGAMSHAPRIGNIKSGLANLGYYRGDIDDLETPGFKNAMRHFATDYGIKTGDYNALLDNIDRNLQNIPSKARLDFDGRRLRFIRDGKMVLNLDAMSGQPEYQYSKYSHKACYDKCWQKDFSLLFIKIIQNKWKQHQYRRIMKQYSDNNTNQIFTKLLFY